MILTKETGIENLKIDALIAMKRIKISVIAFNDEAFNGKSCYNQAFTGCKRTGSMTAELEYSPTTKQPVTTTKPNDGSINRFQLITFISVIVSLFFSF